MCKHVHENALFLKIADTAVILCMDKVLGAILEVFKNIFLSIKSAPLVVSS